MKIGKIIAKKHEIGKIKTIFGKKSADNHNIFFINNVYPIQQYQAFNDILCYKLFFYTHMYVYRDFYTKIYTLLQLIYYKS